MTTQHDYLNFVLETLQGHGGLSTTVRGVARQTASAAAGTAAGGLLAGPAGALIGGIIGGLYGYLTTEEYASLFTFYQSLAAEDRKKRAVGGTSINDFTSWVTRSGNRELLVTLLMELMRQGITSWSSSDEQSYASTSSTRHRGQARSTRNASSPEPSAPPYGFADPPPPYKP
ncbi:unnamed protein product, partial [Mesorhabditis belari]|uniref:Uncharacterized protein n=1 Tax=Mesorhabditis belari TaxID=2138241 RepID=A0AAF3EVN2_9BILA